MARKKTSQKSSKKTVDYHPVRPQLRRHTSGQARVTLSGKTYYLPTYEADGFTHATADPSKLLTVANYFYKDVVSEWLCLKMTRQTLHDAGLTLKFEDPSPVGSKKALTSAESGGERFPHIYGGIPAKGVVVETYVVRRAPDGTYLSIDGLCDGPEAPAAVAMLLMKR